MFGFLGPILKPIAGPLISGVAGLLGQNHANQTNLQESARNRAFQAEQAGINRGFQERMRNTAWQAAVEDMRAAGINPALAYSQGGAAAPGGSMAGGSQASGAQNVASNAAEAVRMAKEFKLLDAQIAKTRSEGEAAAEVARREAGTNAFSGIGMQVKGPDGVWTFDKNLFDFEGPLARSIRAGADLTGANATSARAQAELARSRTRVLAPQAELYGAAGDFLSRILQPLFNGQRADPRRR